MNFYKRLEHETKDFTFQNINYNVLHLDEGIRLLECMRTRVITAPGPPTE